MAVSLARTFQAELAGGVALHLIMLLTFRLIGFVGRAEEYL
jgi:hypothetical protein